MNHSTVSGCGEIEGNTAQFPPNGSSTAPAAAALRIMRYCLNILKAAEKVGNKKIQPPGSSWTSQ